MERLCVIFGGASCEHDISIITGMQLCKNLESKYKLEKIYLGLDNNFYLATDVKDIDFFQNKSKMKLKQIAHIVKGKILSGSDEKEIQEHVSIDTRTMSEGDIFIAIIGKTQDGHIYAKEAEKKKAGVIIVSQEIEDISVPVILVSDTT